uniref:uncharacterized protein LOC120331181 n=1 Tax=Styela clava TaxID=7725 RepID=UPI001939CAA0|nr:uncharacterized protein LOC120331181 [Styela clava]
MALSESSDSFCKTRNEELELLGANYYKLPFCDEDMKHFESMESSDDWVNGMLEDRFMNGTNELLTPSSPSSSSGALSPSSNSSASSSGNGTIEHAYSLINDRPDTPLTAVKFEDFSSDYPIGDLEAHIKEEYMRPFDFEDDFSLQPPTEADFDDEGFIFDTTNDFTAHNCTQIEQVPASTSMSISTPHHTMDKSLASTIESLGNNVITISKMGNTVHVKKENNDIALDYSACRSQQDSAQPKTIFAPISNCSNNENVTTTRPTARTININANGRTDNHTKATTTPSFYVADMTDAQDLISQPTAKVTTNSLTHRTQIQIPTSTLQTILKSGRLITKLQQEGQFLPRIKIKTEPCDGEQQYVRICNPQIELPPTPPSSNTSDNEGSSSPRRGGITTNSNTLGSDMSVRLSSSNLQFMSSGNQLTAQLLSSPQRLAQSHGHVHLTEEEKKTLVSEGYPVPEKLPLTKTEEKALKKIRRKIKNKISAQESRRKKKEYVEALERRMESFNQENGDLRRKLDSLEDSNQSLLGQLRSLQMLVAEKMPKPSRTITTQTSSCLMVVVLCFAVFLGGWLPFLSPFMAKNSMSPYNHAHEMEMSRSWRSRVLLSYAGDASNSYGYCDVNGCYGNPEDEDIALKAIMNGPYQEDNGHEVQEGSETYDEPASGRVVMNDTKDQIGQVIANTMEPRDVAAVLASRKVVATPGRKVQMAAADVMGADSKKFVAPSAMVTE